MAETQKQVTAKPDLMMKVAPDVEGLSPVERSEKEEKLIEAMEMNVKLRALLKFSAVWFVAYAFFPVLLNYDCVMRREGDNWGVPKAMQRTITLLDEVGLPMSEEGCKLSDVMPLWFIATNTITHPLTVMMVYVLVFSYLLKVNKMEEYLKDENRGPLSEFVQTSDMRNLVHNVKFSKFNAFANGNYSILDMIENQVVFQIAWHLGYCAQKAAFCYMSRSLYPPYPLGLIISLLDKVPWGGPGVLLSGLIIGTMMKPVQRAAKDLLAAEAEAAKV